MSQILCTLLATWRMRMQPLHVPLLCAPWMHGAITMRGWFMQGIHVRIYTDWPTVPVHSACDFAVVPEVEDPKGQAWQEVPDKYWPTGHVRHSGTVELGVQTARGRQQIRGVGVSGGASQTVSAGRLKVHRG